MPTAIPEESTAFITFYSFKGGVGRSMALINVAGILAGRGFRVLALDMDLEAPGISYLMRHEAKLSDKLQPGAIDLLSDACDRGEEADLFALSPSEIVAKYSYAYTVPEEIRKSDEGFLRIMPAGQFDGDYQRRLDNLDLGRLYLDGQGEPLIKAFKEVIASSGQFDFVFIDSRTGFSDESGICTRDLADYLVVVMGLNRQNQEGTAEFLRSLRMTGATPKNLRIVLSPVPNGEDDLLEQRENEAAALLSNAWGQPLDMSLQIPYHPRLALTEEPHIFRRSKGYLYDAYVAIECGVRGMMGLDSTPILDQIRGAAENKRADEVLRCLKKLIKLDDAEIALGSLAVELEGLLFQEDAVTLRQFLAETSSLHPWARRQVAAGLHKKKHLDAELFYKRALQGDPNHAITLGNYALFLTDIRKNHDAAEAHYKRALQADPNHANILGNYAIFLKMIRKDHDAAEAYYKRALQADPNHASTLANYANFLTDIRKDHDAAEAHYKRALELDPNNASTLGNYANFLTDIRKHHDAAEANYKRALELDPNNANNLGNCAKLLFILKRFDEAEKLLVQAWDSKPDDLRVQCELLFYACAHAWPKYPEALGKLKALLESGARSEGWRLEENVQVARECGHPHGDFIEALARVISAQADIQSLEPFAPWKAGSF